MTSADSGQPQTRPIPACLDASTLQQLLDLDDGQTGLLVELYGLFKEDTPGRIEGLHRSLAAGDPTSTAELAHAVKGAAGTIGAARMRGIASDLEKAGKGGRVDDQTRQWLADLEASYAETCAALDAYLG